MTFRIATRRSDLAMAQAGWVRLQMQQLGMDAVLLPVDTSGDRTEGASKERWIDDILEALRSGEADLAVHSAKDMPAADPDDLVIAAVPERADPRDVFVAADAAFLDAEGKPRPGARVGTSSLRRSAQLRAAFPGVLVVPMRGNVTTRVRKVTAENVVDIGVLAAAGLDRLRLKPTTVLPLGFEIMMPAPGQGTLAIQCRAADRALQASLMALDHRTTRGTLDAERALTRALGADCALPLGAIAAMHGDTIRLAACVAAPDGSQVLHAAAETDDPERAADMVAQQLRADGADDILEAARAAT